MAPLRSRHLDDPSDHDQWGLRAARIMLQDLRFPRTREALLNRAGAWRLPMPGRVKLRLGDLLEALPNREYESAEDVVRALKHAWPDLQEAQGPWKVEHQDDASE